MADSSPATARRPAPAHTNSGGNLMERDKAEQDGRDKAKLVTPAGRGNKYKDKFHALRIKYDSVTSKHEEYRRDLQVADAKLKKLQAENDLLLDAMTIAVQGQPTLLQLLAQDLPREPNANGHSHHLPGPGPHDHVNGDTPVHPQHPHRPRVPEMDPVDYIARESNGRAS